MYQLEYLDVEENVEYEKTIEKVIKQCFKEEKLENSKLYISITLTTPKNIHKINKQYRETYDVSISRAVAPMNILAEYLIPFIKIGGICICMKGNNANGEIQDSKKAIEVLGGKIEKIIELKLPETDINRNIIIIKKVKNTPNTYPRKPGLPSKQPII